MKIKICDKCKGTNINTLIPKLKKSNPDLEITVGCHNMCGIGRSKLVVILDNKPVIVDNEEELIIKIEENV